MPASRLPFMPLRRLFLDMDSYFASVEQQMQPRLRNRPVGVAPAKVDTTCCIAASYEAKRYGIRTGTKVKEARERCPHIKFVEARHRLYVQTHHRIVKTVERCLHVDRVMSIDEMVCRLTGSRQQPDRALKLARLVKTSLREEIGPYVRCSVGLGPNALLAKIASNMQKPDGLTLIHSEDLPRRLYPLALTDIPGIARNMERRCHLHGIRTVEQLCQLSADDLAAIWQSKVMGRRWWHWLRGDDVDDAETQRRSFSHSRVLPPRQRGDDEAWAVLACLTHKAAARLRKLDYWTCSLTVSIRFLEKTSWRKNLPLTPCRDTLTLLEAARSLWNEHPQKTPLKVSVVLGHLAPNAAVPLPLFEKSRRRIDLARRMDQVNATFGAHTVFFAGMWKAERKDHSPIAFTHVPDL